MIDKIKRWINQRSCKHDWKLFAQSERRGMRFGIYECELNSHPHDSETILRKKENFDKDW